MTDVSGEQPQIFESYKPVIIPDATAETFDVLRAQTGLNETEVVHLIMSIGVDVVRLLIRAGAYEEVEPVLDLSIRRVDDVTIEDVSELPLILKATQSLTGFIEKTKKSTS
jgi:hypothetical protein